MSFLFIMKLNFKFYQPSLLGSTLGTCLGSADPDPRHQLNNKDMYQLETTKTKKDPESRLTIGDKGLMFILAHFKNMPRNWKMTQWPEKGCTLHYRIRNGVKYVGIEYPNQGVAERFYTMEELQAMYDDCE